MIQSAPWKQDFDSYLASVDEVRTSFVLDLEAIKHAPVTTHPVLLEVSIQLQSPREDGLRSKEEAPGLNALEDRIMQHLKSEWHAICVGHFMAEGSLSIVGYINHEQTSKDIDTLLDGIECDSYEISWQLSENQDWAMYLEFLYPDPWSLNVISNRRLVQNLEADGDQLTQPRKLNHFASFSDESSAQTAASGLTSAGFEVTRLELQDDQRWHLSFDRVNALANGKPNEFCGEIFDHLEPVDGEYEGWGCPLVSATESKSISDAT